MWILSTSGQYREIVGTGRLFGASPGGRQLAFWGIPTGKTLGLWVVSFDDIKNPKLLTTMEPSSLSDLARAHYRPDCRHPKSAAGKTATAVESV
jgi:hypothetical protein